MIKNILLLFNLIVLLVFNVIVTIDLTITPNIPAQVEPGSEFNFELKIFKGNISGFAKVQQDLPEGFTATEVDSKGASFTFSENKVKLIWMSLPAEEEFTVNFKVKVDPSVSGTKTIGGKFSYLENNERKSYDIPVKTINVGSATAQTQTPEQSQPQTQTPETIVEPTTGTQQPQGGGSNCTRTITQEGEKYKVEITLQNRGVSGFAKAQDILPAGMRAEEANTNNAVFSFVGNKAKFVWMSLPNEKEIKISYYLFPDGTSLAELNNITGEFSFLENNETKKLPIVTIGAEAMAAKISTQEQPSTTETPSETPSETPTEAPTEAPTETQTQTQTADADEQAKKAAEEKAAKETELLAQKVAEEKKIQEERNRKEEEARLQKEEEARRKQEEKIRNEENLRAQKEKKKQESRTSLTATPAASSGVNFRVQVCAGHQPVGSEHFEKTYKFTEDQIFTENNEGWIKYTIGGFDTYKSARDRREQVTAGYSFPGPFVAAYNNGTRITVQEALMITRQRWVQ